jgi:hypothetical protein
MLTGIRTVRNALAAAVLCIGAVAGGVASASPSEAHAACDRVCLLDALSTYTHALVTHSAAGLPVTADVRYTENGKTLQLGDGVWKTATSFSYRQSIVDASTGQAVFYGGLQEQDGQSAIFVVRLKMAGKSMAEIETLVARRGAHPIFAPENLSTPRSVFSEQVPESERSPRATLIAAANAYFDGIERHDTSIIPFHPDCNRTENGIRTTNNPPRFPLNCPDSIKGLSYISRVRGRRYPIVDTDRGLVFAIVHFDVPGTSSATPPTSDGQINTQLLQPRTLFLYELFKIESGRIREIEAFMTNAAPGASNGWER